ncbi:hypothetical protein [Lentiprolixibacter aurantiacus]|uniref:Lipocalin-like domain-containing protein n=1 Tax=Lentiprolixibacter aurantiacus TaxID=2993939 RepID=A0AAE3MM02_9FLAO|nr:hypothetical protein [Lentiprolixibacter aurantiacus]MCX2720310.1 hypothetical protein [Lentiprolixibacter aurantiacus]
MRKLIGLVLLLLILFAGTAITTTTPPAMHTIEGTWELESFYNYDGEEVTDTVYAPKGYRQVKMYYNGKIMWSRTNPSDTIGRFGFGSYRITSDQLIETIEYGDYQMMQALDTLSVFTFELILTDDNYSQISQDEEGNRTFSENYRRID